MATNRKEHPKTPQIKTYDLAWALKSWRLRYNLSAKQAAEILSMSVETVRSIESQKYRFLYPVLLLVTLAHLRPIGIEPEKLPERVRTDIPTWKR